MTEREAKQIKDNLATHVKNVWNEYHRKTVRDQFGAVAFCLFAVAVMLWLKG